MVTDTRGIEAIRRLVWVDQKQFNFFKNFSEIFDMLKTIYLKCTFTPVLFR